jgi:hypothetical protein
VESAHPNKVTFPASSEAIDALTGGTSKALVTPLVATAPSITRHLMLKSRSVPNLEPNGSSSVGLYLTGWKRRSLWLLGVPLPIIILLALFWHH